MHKLHIKVCGMRDLKNIQSLSTLPITHIGFIFHSKSQRFVQEKLDLKQIDLQTIKKTGVFVNATVEEINAKIMEYDLQAVQLHGAESPAFCQALKGNSVEIIKAFGIDNEFVWTDLLPYEEVVDYFLFDTKTSTHGGSGKSFNWEVLTNYSLDKPYFLSGGLSIDNIERTKELHDERLYGLDLNSKFESKPGIKNIKLIEQALNLLK